MGISRGQDQGTETQDDTSAASRSLRPLHAHVWYGMYTIRRTIRWTCFKSGTGCEDSIYRHGNTIIFLLHPMPLLDAESLSIYIQGFKDEWLQFYSQQPRGRHGF